MNKAMLLNMLNKPNDIAKTTNDTDEQEYSPDPYDIDANQEQYSPDPYDIDANQQQYSPDPYDVDENAEQYSPDPYDIDENQQQYAPPIQNTDNNNKNDNDKPISKNNNINEQLHIPDIQSIITILHQNMHIMKPVLSGKSILEILIQVDKKTDREQQQYINREAAKLMTERDEEEKSKMDNKNDSVCENGQTKPDAIPSIDKTKKEIKKAYKEYEKVKGHKPSDVQAFMTYCKKKQKILKANWSLCKSAIDDNKLKGKIELWNEFLMDYNHFNDNDNQKNCESLQKVLYKLQTFATSDCKHCIDGLLNNNNSNTIIFDNILLCLTNCKDDKIRECIINILQIFYDFSDDNFVSFANKNNIIEYLSKSLRVGYSLMEEEKTKHHTFKLTPESSSRVDMKILQILAVYFSGSEILYSTVFNEIKESIMSPHQHIDFIEYALQVIVTIIQDLKCEKAKKCINQNCKNEMNIDHTIQFAVYTIQTYPQTQADILARALLKALYIDVQQSLIDFGMVTEMTTNNEMSNPPTPKRQKSPIHISESTTDTYSINGNIPPNITLNPNQTQPHQPQNSANMSYQNQNQNQYSMQQTSPYMQNNNMHIQIQQQQQSPSSYLNIAQQAHTQMNSMNSPYSPYQNQYAMHHQTFNSSNMPSMANMTAQYTNNRQLPQSPYQQQQQQQQQQQYAQYYQQQYYQQLQYQQQQQQQQQLQQQRQRTFSDQQQRKFSGQNNLGGNLNGYNNITTRKNSYQAPAPPPVTKPHSNALGLPSLKTQSLALRRMSSDVPIQDKLHATLAQLLLTGVIMTKYPSIHTHIPNYMNELLKNKCKYKLVRMSSDWKNIEFHSIVQRNNMKQNNNTPIQTKGKPKILLVESIKKVQSSFNEKKRKFSDNKHANNKKHSQDLFIYALDKTKREIVIKLICQSRNHTKRWTIALNQIINHFNNFAQ